MRAWRPAQGFRDETPHGCNAFFAFAQRDESANLSWNLYILQLSSINQVTWHIADSRTTGKQIDRQRNKQWRSNRAGRVDKVQGPRVWCTSLIMRPCEQCYHLLLTIVTDLVTVCYRPQLYVWREWPFAVNGRCVGSVPEGRLDPA